MKKFRVLAVVFLVIAAGVQAEDFTLTGTQTKDVTTSYQSGYLYDSSLARILSDGVVQQINAYNTSTANISGGSVNWLSAFGTSIANVSDGSIVELFAENSSIANVSGGSVNYIKAVETSTANITGGSVDRIDAYNASTANISGGSMISLRACDISTTHFIGTDFVLGEGLSWAADSKTILGTGCLSGKWLGSTEVWTINIYRHDITSIIAVPEPCTLLLLGVGGVMMRRK